MRTSENILEITKALLLVQKEVKAPEKNSSNTHLKQSYADISSVIAAIKPVLNKHGIIFVQSPTPSENEEMRLTTRLIHETGQWIESVITVPLAKKDAQGFGSALTYGRRYALNAMLGLPTEDDDGHDSGLQNESKSPLDALNEKDRETVTTTAKYVDDLISSGKVNDALRILRETAEENAHINNIKKILMWLVNDLSKEAINAAASSAKQ